MESKILKVASITFRFAHFKYNYRVLTMRAFTNIYLFNFHWKSFLFSTFFIFSSLSINFVHHKSIGGKKNDLNCENHIAVAALAAN